MIRQLDHRVAVALVGCWFGLAPAAAASPAGPWKQYATPEQAGWSSEKLAAVREQAEKAQTAAFVVVHGGKMLVAWGDVDRPFETYSVRKSLLSGLIGIHVGNKQIDLNKTVGELGIDDDPPLTEMEKSARLLDLIRARSGVYHPAAKEPADMKSERPARGSHAPGSHFWYNNWDFNTIGVAFEKLTGQRIGQAFKAEIAEAIGMEDFRPADAYYQLEPSNSIHPAYGFKLSARDLARYGQLFLQGGEWNGRQVIPSDWIKESTRLHSEWPGGGGYGYMWWSWPAGSFGADSTLSLLNAHDKFSAVGTGGQFLLVIPGADLVFVHRADTENGRRVRGPQVWKLCEMVMAAKSGEPAADAGLVDLSPVSFANALPPRPQRRAIAMTPAEFEAFTGEYAKPPEFRLTVFMFQDRLFATLHGVGEGELLPESENRFFVANDEAVVEFQLDDEGRVVRAIITYAGQTETLERKD